MTVKFGLFLPTRDYPSAKAAAVHAEAQGFWSVSLDDHFASQDGIPRAPQLECLSLLTAIAADDETRTRDPHLGKATGPPHNVAEQGSSCAGRLPCGSCGVLRPPVCWQYVGKHLTSVLSL